ncbi:MAG TPA: hypothetical protein VN939_04070 [Chthoniobacterales bacterium]|jgi:hypothetical protein|nr:hypothetical protein [Chthoniobacterales bacterium]
MKLLISLTTVFSLQLAGTALATDYSALAAQGYRWVIANGPYACSKGQDVERVVGHHTDATELDVVQNAGCYYLIPGTIAKVISEDPARGISQIQLGNITIPLWTYSRFLSKTPIPDTSGVIETPEAADPAPATQSSSPSNH